MQSTTQHIRLVASFAMQSDEATLDRVPTKTLLYNANAIVRDEADSGQEEDHYNSR